MQDAEGEQEEQADDFCEEEMAAAAEADASWQERQQQLQARQPAGSEGPRGEPALERVPESAAGRAAEAAAVAAASAAGQDTTGAIDEEMEDAAECGPSFEVV
jgi:hypothetical protein